MPSKQGYATEEVHSETDAPWSSFFNFIQTSIGDWNDRLPTISNGLQTFKRKIADLEEELHNANTQIEQLGRQIEDDQVIRLSLLKAKHSVSDMQMSGELDGIYQGILNWAAELPEFADFDLTWPKVHQALNNTGRAGNFNLFPQSAVLEKAPSEALAFEICRIVWERLLNASIIGAYGKTRTSLEGIVNNMAKLKPKIDSEILSISKSVALRAYAECPDYRLQVEEECHSTIRSVDISILDNLRFHGDFDKRHCLRRLEEQIAGPAAELGTTLMCSTETYKWVWYHGPRSLHKRTLSLYNAIDCETHCYGNLERLQAPEDDSAVGQVWMPIFPSLYREGQNSGEYVLVSKGYILVSLYKKATAPKSAELDFSVMSGKSQESNVNFEHGASCSHRMDVPIAECSLANFAVE